MLLSVKKPMVCRWWLRIEWTTHPTDRDAAAAAAVTVTAALATDDDASDKIHPQNMGTGKSTKIDKNMRDEFVPRTDTHMNAVFDGVENDNDVWVERFYRSKKGRIIPFFMSLNSNRRVIAEPPTGSSVVISWQDLITKRYPNLTPHLLDAESHCEHYRYGSQSMERPRYHE